MKFIAITEDMEIVYAGDCWQSAHDTASTQFSTYGDLTGVYKRECVYDTEEGFEQSDETNGVRRGIDYPATLGCWRLR